MPRGPFDPTPTLRDSWAFPYTAGQLAEMAQARLTFHRGRQAHWVAESAEAERSLRAEGIQLREAVLPLPGLTNYVDHQPLVDQRYVQRFEECQAKVREHAGLCQEYARWQRLFATIAPAREFTLTVHDVAYFEMPTDSEQGPE